MKCYSSEEEAADASWKEAQTACRTSLGSLSPPDGWCPGTFDGWSCWNHTGPNNTAVAQCPNGEHTVATKLCRSDGTWWRNAAGNEWANYTQCFEDTSFYDYHRSLNIILYIGYSFSIVLCLLAILVHFLCKSLDCGRTKIHQHLFASYVLSCSSQLFWLHVQSDVIILTENPGWCRLLHVLAIYFLLSNYAWMFCEGFYLYCILRCTFVRDRPLLIAACCIGWVAPTVPTLAYVALRTSCVQHSLQLQNCWTQLIPNLWWSYASFSLICQLCNFTFLIAILRLVYLKSTDPVVDSQTGISLKKLTAVLRALLILVPLFGVQYLLSCFRPTNPDQTLTAVYEICYSLFTSLQGSAVAALFCFCNSEVKSVISRKWLYWKTTCQAVTVVSAGPNTSRAPSFSVVNPIKKGEKTLDDNGQRALLLADAAPHKSFINTGYQASFV